MNNCPKCGNPLQVGTTSCPICGTNIASAVQPVQNENGKTTVTVASVAKAVPTSNVANTSSAQPTQVAPVAQATQPAQTQVVQQATTTQTTQPLPEQTVAPQPVQPVEKPVVEPTQNVAPVAPTTEAKEQVPIDPNSIAPVIQPIEMSSPVPSIPSSLSESSTVVNAPVENKKSKETKKINKNILVIAGILAVVIIAAVLMMNIKPKTNLNNNAVNNKNSTAEITAVSTNGYTFNLENGWLITEDGTNVIVTNKEETVAVKLNYTKDNLETISKSTIESYFASRTDFTNTEVIDTTISAKQTYLVNTQINQAMVQVYYINGGSNLTLGAVAVYQSSDTKEKYEANVTELIGSLSYSDESLKAINSMEMYSNIFNVYNGVFQYQQQNIPIVEDNNNNQPVVEQPTDNPTQEQPTVENPTE